jgi:hypothetical protein
MSVIGHWSGLSYEQVQPTALDGSTVVTQPGVTLTSVLQNRTNTMLVHGNR